MSKEGNIYFVNTVNIENTGNISNILLYLILPMDCSLLV